MAYFDKFRYPETSFSAIKKVLLQFGFSQKYDDGEYVSFTKGDRRVMVPKEDKIVGITIGDIISQSGIEDSSFVMSLINFTKGSNADH